MAFQHPHSSALFYLLNASSIYIYNAPQAPDRFNPKVRVQTCGIIQKLSETKHIETMMFGKSVIALVSKIEPKMSKYDMKKWLKTGKKGSKVF